MRVAAFLFHAVLACLPLYWTVVLDEAAILAAVSNFADRWVACVGQADPGRLWAPASCRRLPAAVAVAPGRLRACKQLLTWGALLPHGPARRHAAVRMRCLAYAQGHAEAHLHASGHGQAGGTLHAHAGLHGQASLSEHGQASPHGQMPRVKVRPQEGSAERYLMDQCGVPESAVESVIQRAVTWRVTAAGRSLIDRRHRSKVERNMPIVGAYLTDVCGVAPGKVVSCPLALVLISRPYAVSIYHAVALGTLYSVSTLS